jgi:hypothetical protein
MTTTPTVHLQGIGRQYAMPADDLRPGDVTLWNYGYHAKVEEIVRETATQVIVRITSAESGQVHDRRLKKTRLVAVTSTTLDSYTARQSAAEAAK